MMTLAADRVIIMRYSKGAQFKVIASFHTSNARDFQITRNSPSRTAVWRCIRCMAAAAKAAGWLRLSCS